MTACTISCVAAAAAFWTRKRPTETVRIQALAFADEAVHPIQLGKTRKVECARLGDGCLQLASQRLDVLGPRCKLVEEMGQEAGRNGNRRRAREQVVSRDLRLPRPARVAPKKPAQEPSAVVVLALSFKVRFDQGLGSLRDQRLVFPQVPHRRVEGRHQRAQHGRERAQACRHDFALGGEGHGRLDPLFVAAERQPDERSPVDHRHHPRQPLEDGDPSPVGTPAEALSERVPGFVDQDAVYHVGKRPRQVVSDHRHHLVVILSHERVSPEKPNVKLLVQRHSVLRERLDLGRRPPGHDDHGVLQGKQPWRVGVLP